MWWVRAMDFGGDTVKTLGLAATAAAAGLGLLALAHAGFAQDKKTATPATTSTASPCKGLDQAGCTAKAADCQWIAPKSGKQKPYCRLKPKPAKKAAPKTSPPKQ
jgi:hypothetical protein